ncbi:MAG: carbohydrate kinase [Chlorobi bacterium]|nr:carbohydrate kinase [Chlorobiota bacterium]
MVYTLGESLLDIIVDNPQNIIARPGGSMLNTAVSLGRTAIPVSLISETGDDGTAKLILQFLQDNKVRTKFVKKYYHRQTSVALAYLDEHKIPSFSIYKSYPEKRHLIAPSGFDEKDILAFGSLYSLDPALRGQIVQLLVAAKKAGVSVIYDPNIRKHCLENKDLMQSLKENISFADIIKGSDADFINLFGEKPVEAYYDEIKKINPEAAFVLTLGEKGVIGFIDNEKVQLPAEKVNVVSTIGAGDAFTAGMIHYLEKNYNKRGNGHDNHAGKEKKLTKPEFRAMLQSGIHFSAKVCEVMDNYIPKS